MLRPGERGQGVVEGVMTFFITLRGVDDLSDNLFQALIFELLLTCILHIKSCFCVMEVELGISNRPSGRSQYFHTMSNGVRIFLFTLNSLFPHS